MKALLIVDCHDGMMWYASKVGQVVPLVRELSDCFMAREPAGYSNIVDLRDGVIVDLPDTSELAEEIRGKI